MKTLIVFGTKHGCTERCAKTLSEKFDGEVDLINLKEGKNIDISQYDKVIIGDSIGGEFIFKKMKFFKVFLNPPQSKGFFKWFRYS